MLPKSRIVSAVILGVGLALLVAGVLYPRIVVTDARMPLNLEQTTVTLVDPNGTQRSNIDGSMYVGPMTKQYHVQVVPPIDQDLATARVGISLRRGDSSAPEADRDRLVDATLWTYSFERKSGMNTSPMKVVDTPATAADSVEFSGHWVKFPTNAERTTYEVFDSVLRGTAPAVFQESLEREGRTIYRYRQEIAPTNIADRYPSMFGAITLPAPEPEPVEGEEPAPPAEIEAKLFHSGTRDFYVDQITGMVVDMEEHIIDYYADANGGKLADAHLFAGKVDDTQSAQLLAQIQDVQDGSVQRIVAWVIAGIGAVLTLLGLAGCFRFGRN